MDARLRELKYEHKVQKKDMADSYARKKMNYTPSGYMTVEEYNSLSKYTDQPAEIKAPAVKKSESKYVPEPSYKIVRYNDPPGSPELNITRNFYKLKQYNGTGIISPDISFIVYPVVYYYPDSTSTASDLFVIPLKDGTPISRIKNAKASDRIPEPIVSTEKSIDVDTAFRSLTPVDFSADGRYLLIKEKIGSSQDGIWKTNSIVYDFVTKTSYNLCEIRDAIIYYWKENKGLNLEELRWDIYPIGFLMNEQDRIAVNAYAYTGNTPVNLGIWSVDVHGEQSRLISFSQKEVEFSVNGFKLMQDGNVPKTIVKSEQKALIREEKSAAKTLKRKAKEDKNAIKRVYKESARELDYQYKEELKDLKKLNSLKGSTSENDLPEAFKEYKIKSLDKEVKSLEKNVDKEQRRVDKINKKLDELTAD